MTKYTRLSHKDKKYRINDNKSMNLITKKINKKIDTIMYLFDFIFLEILLFQH